MLRETLTVWGLLTLAALLEAGGDALVRLGLTGSRWALAGGALALVGYGFLVNLTRWDFGRLMASTSPYSLWSPNCSRSSPSARSFSSRCSWEEVSSSWEA